MHLAAGAGAVAAIAVAYVAGGARGGVASAAAARPAPERSAVTDLDLVLVVDCVFELAMNFLLYVCLRGCPPPLVNILNTHHFAFLHYIVHTL